MFAEFDHLYNHHLSICSYALSGEEESVDQEQVQKLRNARRYARVQGVHVWGHGECMVNATDANNKQEMGHRYIRDALADVVEDGVGTNRIRQ